MKLSELNSLKDVEVGTSYTMPNGIATLEKSHAKASESIGFRLISKEGMEPFKNRTGCYTSLHISFNELSGRGGHRESFYFDMDMDSMMGSIKKLIHVFKNCEESGEGKIALFNAIDFDLGLTPVIDPATNQQTVVSSNDDLATLSDSLNVPIMFERFGDPVDTGKIKNGKAVTYQQKRVFQVDASKLAAVVEQIANVISNNLVGAEYYLKFEARGRKTTCEIKSA